MTIENVCRINVWPTMAAARAAFDGANGSELSGRMIVWPTTALAKEYYTENSGEGGGGAPPWVPADARIHIDFLGGTPQGRAWVDGTGEVAIATLLGTDPNINSGSGWGSTLAEYNPAQLAADGYGSAPNRVVAYIGSLRAAVLVGATLRVVVKIVTKNPFSILLATSEGGDDASIVEAIENIVNPSNVDLVISTWADGALGMADSAINPAVGAINVFAITKTPVRIEAAVNGSAAIAAVLDETDYPRVTVIADVKAAVGLMQSITSYDPLPTTAGLSALSQVT